MPGVRRHRVRARAGHPRRLVRLRLEPRGRAALPPGAHVAGGSLSRGQRSAPRLVPELAPRRPGHAREAALPRRGHPRLHRHGRRQEDVEVARQRDRAGGHHQGERRRGPPAVGRDGGLPRGNPGRPSGPGARRRGVPQDPQHAALSRLEPLRLRSGGRSGPARADARGRSVRARPLRRGGHDRAARVRRVRLPDDLPGHQPVHHRGPERLLCRRLEGPALHVRGRRRPSGAPRRRRCTSSPTA